MRQKLKMLLWDRSLWIFALIGVGNTLLNWLIMLGMNALLPLPENARFWVCTITGYTITTAISFVLNRRFSFQSSNSLRHDLSRFLLVFGVCFLLANLVAKPLVLWALALPAFSRFTRFANPIAMIFGNVVFTALNYFGQRFFAFKNEEAS